MKRQVVGSKKTGGEPDVGSSLLTPGLIQNHPTGQKESHRARRWWALAVFLLKNVDFEFPICYRSLCPISYPGTLAITKLISRNSQVLERSLKGVKCLPLHNENQGNGENKPPSRIYIFFFFFNSMPFALYTNSTRLSSMRENIRFSWWFVKYFINSNLVKKETIKMVDTKRKCLVDFSNLTTSVESQSHYHISHCYLRGIPGSPERFLP